MFRLLYLTFFKEFRGTAEQKSHLHESPTLITFPLIVLAILATLGGLIFTNKQLVERYLAPLFTKCLQMKWHEKRHKDTELSCHGRRLNN
jgi:NADH-quinone oxidoreductase subunit L